MIGIFVNFAVALLGALLGPLIRSSLSERLQTSVMRAIALCIMVIGITGAIATQDQLLLVVCAALGTLLGEAVDIERGVNTLGNYAQRKLGGSGRFAEGFVTATLVFSVGSMAVIGSLAAGLNNDPTTLLAKSAIDFVSSFFLASAYGAGVMLACVPMTLYQGGLALLATVIKPFLSDDVIREMKAVGSVIIIGLSLNMLGIMKENTIRVCNMLPAMFLPIGYIPLSNFISQIL